MRAKDNLRNYHIESTRRRRLMVTQELHKLYKDKAHFEDLTGLAKRVAEMVTLQESNLAIKGKMKPRKPISHQTLIRKNSKYRHLLLSFQCGDYSIFNNANNNEFKVSSNDRLMKNESNYVRNLAKNNPALEAYFLKAKLEYQAVIRENKSLKIELQRLKTIIDKKNYVKKNENSTIVDESDQLNSDLIKTVTAFLAFISHLNGFELDYDNKALIDHSNFESSIKRKSIIDKALLEPILKIGKEQYQLMAKLKNG